ncbi:MAG: SDR family oxidoreductase [Schwartzia succinivorans]|uniref:SDR family NAD(P)-dependent oxidoreductase n=1 Tax=Schwartzia succinivorans TaxID=55507 RepID=UPI00235459AD|nr:SDR family oxidoreductase [Schwartzia succinivorans]MBE6096540.1 SDR family oxidoreductase [Schwartzia succinivorans]
MKNILITGASSGIGEATARYLASMNYYVLLVARNEEKLKKICADLGENASYIVGDLRDIDSVEGIFHECKRKCGKLDGMVYCAGIGGASPVRSEDWHVVEDVMRVNCLAFMQMAKYAVTRKYSSDGCSIVAMSSLSSVTCYHGMAAYSMSKSSINTLCKVLSKEVIRRNIRVNTIMPGYVRTPMMAGTEETDIIDEQPWGYIEPTEIAWLIEFLLSEKAKNITGACIPVSAGMIF